MINLIKTIMPIITHNLYNILNIINLTLNKNN